MQSAGVIVFIGKKQFMHTAGLTRVFRKRDIAGDFVRSPASVSDLRRTNYNDTFLYYLLPRLTPATYFLEMNPLSANRPGSRLGADVLSADWLILDHRLDEWNEPNESSRFGPDAPNQVVQSNFELRVQQGFYDIYRRK